MLTSGASGQQPRKPRFFTRMSGRLPSYESAVLLILAVAVGLTSGMGAVAFHWLIEGAHTIFVEWPEPLSEHYTFLQGQTGVIVMTVAPPMLGGLIAGLIVWLLARHDHSHGTASVMEAVALHGGRLRRRPLLVKSAAAGLLIGAGGSAGPEDPSVKIGAIIGASIGGPLRLSVKRTTTLITAGVASAIAAIFNAPIAGVFFALEVIAGDFSTALFAPVVLASVAGSIVGRALLGGQPIFAAPPHDLVNPLIETPLYALLGLLAALIGVVFTRAVFFSESFFDRLRLPAPLLAGVGGLSVGLIALTVPEVLGVGYDLARSIINGTGPVGWLLLLVLGAKFLATIITLGAVRVGGTFAPSLVLGAIVGGLFGQVVNLIAPASTGPAGAYALVGMGAVLTAVVRAPLTAVLLLFEVTGDYRLILAMMACVATSYLGSAWLHPESIYTERLARKGIRLRFGRDVNLLELVKVQECMTPDFTTVPTTMALHRLRHLFDSTRHHGFPVLDADGLLYGIVTLTDLRVVTIAGYPAHTPVLDIATRDLIVIYPDQTLNEALEKFALADVGRIPVVSRDDPRKLLGVLRRTDIVKGYQRGVMQRAAGEQHQQHPQSIRFADQHEAQVITVSLSRQCASDGRAVRDIHLPEGVIITSIRRNDESIIPHGATVLYGGDELIILARPDQVPDVEDMLIEGICDLQEPRYHELVLPDHAPAVGRQVASLPLPQDALIVTLRRDGHTHAVHGHTRLEAGDELIILAPPADFPATVDCLTGENKHT